MDSDTLVNLKKKKWYINSNHEIKKQLKSLPKEFDGFLSDISHRKSFIGRVEIIKLIKILVGNYLVIPQFQVRSLDTNEIFTYEFASWKFGRFPGYKGIILIEIDGAIKYFIMKYGAKFPLGENSYDAIGTFYNPDDVHKTITVPSRIRQHLFKFVGPNVHFKKFIDLGVLNPDQGMSNNHINLFATIIDDESSKVIEKLLSKNQDKPLVLGYEIEIIPISKIDEFINKCNDSFFLSCLSRLRAKQII